MTYRECEGCGTLTRQRYALGTRVVMACSRPCAVAVLVEPVELGSPRSDGLCLVEGCDSIGRGYRAAHGLCQLHLARYRRTGNPAVKLRARGVIDGPVVVRVPHRRRGRALGRQQAQMVLLMARGDVLTYGDAERRLGTTRQALASQVNRIRGQFGYGVIESVYGVGYRLAGPLPGVEAT